ncbi:MULTISPECIES: TlpA family protein disulfide reductase [Dyadobacter]|jgi:thiol-disulfide isomerase/thioredoxin|uniref:TlpA family protein disulfide reductase n=1 Tax=Dyadobacter chenhuakuii TaxID=2909339 RepID=A0A9X1QH04_9BACT|nr:MULTISPECIES: TlpA family protein disulfide reductase [Dyadobacter]MCF2500931.1 TlpA family protein disulfide reductase [Dyadobacter chenhuakuii]MCF2519205.1 TlpA family protein disulfide reductase [Dyadobacter sp. CY351]
MTANSRKFFLIVLLIVAAAAVYYSFVKPIDNKEANVESAAPGQAETASVYLSELRDLEGKPVAMDEDKLVFVNVWATWCGPCNMEMPGIQKLYDKYKAHEKVAFYIISDEDAETVNPFIARKGYKLPFYQFAGAYPPALDGNAIPRTYIIYKGKILVEEIGASQWDRPEITDLIDKQLAEI